VIGRPARVPELRLVAERPVRDLLPKEDLERAESSGVLAMDGRLLVIFDDSTAIGILDQDLSRTGGNRLIYPDPRLASDDQPGTGYEDIARDPESGRLYLLVEAVQREERLLPRVEILDADFQRHSQAFLDFSIEADNKGMEGLACITRDGELTLVALCEGNRCRGGREGRRPGGGRLQLFRPAAEICAHVGTVDLPTHLWFVDFSSVAVRDNRLAVLSQRSSALWVGAFRSGSWEIVDHGQCFNFPRDDEGNVQYRTAEGLSWLDDDHLVVVSDRVQRGKRRGRGKQRSVHVFALR
jgi:hypothetical protein